MPVRLCQVSSTPPGRNSRSSGGWRRPTPGPRHPRWLAGEVQGTRWPVLHRETTRLSLHPRVEDKSVAQHREQPVPDSQRPAIVEDYVKSLLEIQKNLITERCLFLLSARGLGQGKKEGRQARHLSACGGPWRAGTAELPSPTSGLPSLSVPVRPSPSQREQCPRRATRGWPGGQQIHAIHPPSFCLS